MRALGTLKNRKPLGGNVEPFGTQSLGTLGKPEPSKTSFGTSSHSNLQNPLKSQTLAISSTTHQNHRTLQHPRNPSRDHAFSTHSPPSEPLQYLTTLTTLENRQNHPEPSEPFTTLKRSRHFGLGVRG